MQFGVGPRVGLSRQLKKKCIHVATAVRCDGTGKAQRLAVVLRMHCEAANKRDPQLEQHGGSGSVKLRPTV